MTTKRRIIAALLALAILFVIALSVCVTVAEAAHDCTGADCYVCRILGTLVCVIRSLSLSAVFSALYGITVLRQPVYRADTVRFPYRHTPVSDKVRLLN